MSKIVPIILEDGTVMMVESSEDVESVEKPEEYLGGEAGIPYITKGTAESNLKITVECTFPDK